jgi:hypothetical protein
LFGAAGYATLIGRLARFGLLSEALSPSVAALVLDRFGAGAGLALIATLALVDGAVTAALWLHLARTRSAAGT